MTREQNIKAILESVFSQAKDELIDIAVKNIMTLNDWIPVSTRMPTREEFIESNGLFIVSDGNRSYAEYFDIYNKQMFREPTMEGFRVDRCVSKWMSLPKP